MEVLAFQEKIYNFYAKNKRDFAWRNDINSYRILISEVMLQQTQTARVQPKFIAWLDKFPDIVSLAQASQFDVLSAWQGLGYNRRGLFLHQSAIKIVQEFHGIIPDDPVLLQTLPGVGLNTAGSIAAFAFNKSTIFIETNIRTVFLHEFFQNQKQVHDQEILNLVAVTLDHHNPRQWYWALMDYGVYLKTKLKINNKLSAHYSKQSKFIGSRRQVRGLIVKILAQTGAINHDDLLEAIASTLPENQHDVSLVLMELMQEKIIKFCHNQYCL